MNIYLGLVLLCVAYLLGYYLGMVHGWKDSEPLRDIQKYLCVSCRHTVAKWLGEDPE